MSLEHSICKSPATLPDRNVFHISTEYLIKRRHSNILGLHSKHPNQYLPEPAMKPLQIDTIKDLADSAVIFKRGETLQHNGAFRKIEENTADECYAFEVDGNYGNYTVDIRLNGAIKTHCTCPYPGEGCKHVVAALLQLLDEQERTKRDDTEGYIEKTENNFLSYDEIKQQALEDRTRRGLNEKFTLTEGDMIKGDHLLTTMKGKEYQVTLHDPLNGYGHCSCPDYLTNKLGTCKHLVFASHHFLQKSNFTQKLSKERFPYIDIFWDSIAQTPRLFHEQEHDTIEPELVSLLDRMFGNNHLFTGKSLSNFITFLKELEQYKNVRIQEPVLDKISNHALEKELEIAASTNTIMPSDYLKVQPYPYQEKGISFGLYKKAVLIGDEMGLGKTLQAIALGILKSKIFGFNNILVVTLSSLKQQWQREIERFSNEQSCIISGSAAQRNALYIYRIKAFSKSPTMKHPYRYTT